MALLVVDRRPDSVRAACPGARRRMRGWDVEADRPYVVVVGFDRRLAGGGQFVPAAVEPAAGRCAGRGAGGGAAARASGGPGPIAQDTGRGAVSARARGR